MIEASTCASCGHSREWHDYADDRPCMATVFRYINSEYGPLRRVPTTCSCTGYQPRKQETMTTTPESDPVQHLTAGIDQAAGAVEQAAADHGTDLTADATAAADVIHEANAAYSALHSTLHIAYQQWQDAVAAAHADYSSVMARLHHTVTTARPDTEKQAAQ